MNILIIEDDQRFGKNISEVFSGKDLTNRVTLMDSFENFLGNYTTVGLYDIILTDINLGNYRTPEGFEIIKKIREHHRTIPIIVISGYDDIDKLRYAFSLGINDYIIKPVRLKELEVRVLNWLHTNYAPSLVQSSGKIYSYKGITYNIDQNRFYFRDNHIPLSKNNKYIFSLFFSQPEKILSEKYLCEKVWGDVFHTGKRNLRVNILRLKKKLAIYGIDSWIQNIHSEGYILDAENYCKIYPKP